MKGSYDLVCRHVGKSNKTNHPQLTNSHPIIQCMCARNNLCLVSLFHARMLLQLSVLKMNYQTMHTGAVTAGSSFLCADINGTNSCINTLSKKMSPLHITLSSCRWGLYQIEPRCCFCFYASQSNLWLSRWEGCLDTPPHDTSATRCWGNGKWILHYDHYSIPVKTYGITTTTMDSGKDNFTHTSHQLAAEM